MPLGKFHNQFFYQIPLARSARLWVHPFSNVSSESRIKLSQLSNEHRLISNKIQFY